MGERWEGPGEVEREAVQVWRVGVLVEFKDEVLERQEHPGVDLQRQVQVQWTATGIFGVEVDLPRLAE